MCLGPKQRRSSVLSHKHTFHRLSELFRFLSVVDHILDILNQPFRGLPGAQSNFPQITDLSQVTSEAVQVGGDADQLESAAGNLSPTVSFVNGKHEVRQICLFCDS